MSRGAYERGLAAEDIALRHYLERGATLLARRWKVPEGEIDLIVECPGTLVFVEVKARRSLEQAAFSLTPAQQQRLGHAAMMFLAQHPTELDCRFDLALVDRAGRCDIVENALSFDAL